MWLFNGAFTGRLIALRLIAGRTALLAVALAGLTLYAGCNSDAEVAPIGGLGTGGDDYYGVAPLEETIAGADVIARVQLRSVTAVAEQDAGETEYIAALDFRFRVLEYIRGGGGNELVAVAYDTGQYFSTSASAIARANVLKDRRDTQWDDRDAVIFLDNAYPLGETLPSTSRAGRYRFAAISFHSPYIDYYTVASPWEKRWLPSESAGGRKGPAKPMPNAFFSMRLPLPLGGQ